MRNIYMLFALVLISCSNVDDDTPTPTPVCNIMWYDGDEDGYGGDNMAITCDTSKYIDVSGDCDDTDPAVYPSAKEIRDDKDNNCNNVVDEDPTSDEDGDGYSENDGDCDDYNTSTYPSADEICDSIDNDCEGTIDNSSITWYYDFDRDGFGSSLNTSKCKDTLYVDMIGDCDDQNSQVNPDAEEICDGMDNDCDGTIDYDSGALWYYDADGDGYGIEDSYLHCPGLNYVLEYGDCDNYNLTYYPDAPEYWDGEGNDNNCNGLVDNKDVVFEYEKIEEKGSTHITITNGDPISHEFGMYYDDSSYRIYKLDANGNCVKCLWDNTTDKECSYSNVCDGQELPFNYDQIVEYMHPTFYLKNTRGDCITWGNDLDYYENCEPIDPTL